ncbi:MAG: hypothetical protein HW421_192 [Ignavibacteria bacterium]|nr:hypothetical protein [Ignavibacteria bacterium]
MAETRINVNLPMKSRGASVLLTIFFGGLGLLYATTKGGIIMTIVEVINLFLCFLVIGFFLLPIIHIITIVWGLKAVDSYNKELIASVNS